MKLLLLICILTLSLFGAPALAKYREFTQSDGTTFTAKAVGNQHLHWFESEDGEILQYNPKTKNFEYAIIQDERLRASGARYEEDGSIRARSIARVSKISSKELQELWAGAQKRAHEKKETMK